MQKNLQEIIHISFNQDQTYFAIGTQKGYKIFKLDNEVTEEISRQFGAGIGIVEMINKSNIFALVGGGRTPRYHKNKLMIWDDVQMKCVVEVCCKSEIKSVKIRQDCCVVILETKVIVFNLADFRVLETYETCPNPKGLCSVSNLKEELTLAYPSKKIGFVELVCQSQRKSLEAHKSTLCALELCPNGFKVATASEKGTIIRIFDVALGECIQQLRRGSEYATIYCLAYDIRSRWLACSSDSGTVHIFSLKPSSQQKEESQRLETRNKKSKLSIFSVISSYFDSEWSFALLRTNQKKTKVAFLNDTNSIAVISTRGNINIADFDPEKGGQCRKLVEYNIFSKE